MTTRGEYDDAVASYRAAIGSAPQQGEAYYSLANLKVYEFADAEIEAMHEQEQNANLGHANCSVSLVSSSWLFSPHHRRHGRRGKRRPLKTPKRRPPKMILALSFTMLICLKTMAVNLRTKNSAGYSRIFKSMESSRQTHRRWERIHI